MLTRYYFDIKVRSFILTFKLELLYDFGFDFGQAKLVLLTPQASLLHIWLLRD